MQEGRICPGVGMYFKTKPCPFTCWSGPAGNVTMFRHERNTRSSSVEPLLFMQMMNRYFSATAGSDSPGKNVLLIASVIDICRMSIVDVDLRSIAG